MRIGIVGLGLIGGSLAIDLRHLGHTILGVSRRQQTCEQAIARGITDQASTDLALVATAEVVFLCTPLAAIEPTVIELVRFLPTTTVLTDVGSVKGSVVDRVAPHWPNFVGGHPMAGTADQGLDAAQSQLFVDRPYVLTPTDTTPTAATATVAALAESLQARLYYCSPTEHDRAVAWISHLPVMISAGLITACLSETDPGVLRLAQKLASSGFRDTSRVGGGNPELGVMMAQYNQSALLQSLYAYREQLQQIIQVIEQSNWSHLEERLMRTQQSRTQFNATQG